jgi:hypothetical protein
VNLREQIEFDLVETLEGDDWGLPVVLRSPDGVIQDKAVVLTANDISFLAADKSINSVDTDFRNYRLSVGDEILVSGSVNNTGVLTIESVEKNKITIAELIVDESSGAEFRVINNSTLLQGQVLYDTIIDNPETGSEVIVHDPVVTLRRTSLLRVPIPTEKNRWLVSIPEKPSMTASLRAYVMGRPSEDGGSIGFIRLYLMKPVQS